MNLVIFVALIENWAERRKELTNSQAVSGRCEIHNNNNGSANEMKI